MFLSRFYYLYYYVTTIRPNFTLNKLTSSARDRYPQRTIFDNVEAAGLSFGIYYQNIPATLFYQNLRKLKYVDNFHSYKSSFKSDAKKGKLPNYAVVEQRYVDTKADPANDDHPSHDVYHGQMLVKEVLLSFLFGCIEDCKRVEPNFVMFEFLTNPSLSSVKN